MHVCLHTVIPPPIDARLTNMLHVWRLVIDTEPCSLPTNQELLHLHYG